MRSYMMEDASAVINIHPNVDILSIHQYEKLYMMEDASPVIDIHLNVDILSTHQYEKLYMMEDASGGAQTSSCYGWALNLSVNEMEVITKDHLHFVYWQA